MEQTKILTDTATQVINATGTPGGIQGDVWFYIALVEGLLLVTLLYFVFRRKEHSVSEKQRLKEEVKSSGEIDFRNIINSSFHATELYDQLKVKCHPDRFIGEAQKVDLANELFQELTENRTNYNKLLTIKERAQQELNIKF